MYIVLVSFAIFISTRELNPLHYKNKLFHCVSLQNNPLLVTEIRDDLKSECEKFGEVKKVIVFDVSTLVVSNN